MVLKAVYSQLNFFKNIYTPFICSQIRNHIFHTFSAHYTQIIHFCWMGYEQTSSDFKCLQGFVLALWVCEGFWRDNAPLMAEVVKLITAWKEESVGQREWNIPKHCVWSCCSSLYVIISAELSKRKEQRNSGGLHSGVKGTEEELQNDGMGVRTSATKGKSESVLSWKLAWMWRTNKNKSVYLKGATGEGVIWKETT